MNTLQETVEEEIARLKLKRDELRGRLENIKNDIGAGLDADSEERAIQLENAEVLDGIANAAAEELQRIQNRLHELGA
jgi:hypothetical protein